MVMHELDDTSSNRQLSTSAVNHCQAENLVSNPVPLHFFINSIDDIIDSFDFYSRYSDIQKNLC
jgi:hypothetical protein